MYGKIEIDCIKRISVPLLVREEVGLNRGKGVQIRFLHSDM